MRVFWRCFTLIWVLLSSFTSFAKDGDANFLENLNLSSAEKKWLKQNQVIKVHPDTWPPFNFWDDTRNKNRGIAVDLLQWISQKTGLQFDYHMTQMSLDRLLKEFEMKNMDLSPSLQYQEVRENYLIYTDHYYRANFGLYVTKPSLKVPHDLNGLRISCEKSSTTSKYIIENFPDVEIVDCPTERDGLLLVSQGKVDAHAGCIEVCDYLIGGSGSFDAIQLFRELRVENDEIYFAVRKDWPELASIIDKSLQLMPVEKKNAILRKYEIELFWKRNQNYAIIAGVFVFVIVMLLFITIFLLYKRSRKAAYFHQLARQKAEESAKFKSAFLANMSHEIRSPMNAILGLTSLLKLKYPKDQEYNEYLSYITKSGQQLLSLINDILDLSKMETGEISINIEAFSVIDLLNEVFQTHQPLAKEKGLHLNLDIIFSDDLWVKSDRAKVLQVITNLVSNGIKYTEYGQVKVGCSISDQNSLQFYVEDTGVGIPEDQKALIFDRFKRLDQTKHVKGTGLGLAISKALTELLGGNIRVDEKSEGGSIFYFSIPYQKANPDLIETSSTPDFEGKPIFDNRKVLLAEDHDFNYIFLAQVLENVGLNVIRAHNGKEAIKIIQHEHIDLVLMDIKMPITTGYEAIQEIKKIKPQLPVIVQSAYALPDEKEKAYRCGCDNYITKPIDCQELFLKISLYIPQSSLIKEL